MIAQMINKITRVTESTGFYLITILKWNGFEPGNKMFRELKVT